MPFASHIRPSVLRLLTIAALFAAPSVCAAMDPRFELDTKSLSAAPEPGAGKQEKRRARPRPARHDRGEGSGTVHTVRSGDNLFKILMRDYGLSNAEADAFIEEIRRENNIYDIRRLKVGQKIVIPPLRRRADGSPDLAGETVPAVQALRLEAPARMDEQESLRRFTPSWEQVVPATPQTRKPLTIQSSTFSLALDPQRYPVYAAQDGGRILVDSAGSIPPLVRSLIQEKDPSVRIVSESPSDGRRFLASMLSSAGFYSVEEDFSMEFGVDPKLTVRADFKVEKTADSLIRQDLLLVNGGHTAMPAVLGEFLKKEGVSVVEPFATPMRLIPAMPRTVHLVPADAGQLDVVDQFLMALDVAPDRERRIDVFAADNNGISLSVKSDRTFVRGGERFVVSRFDGDPVVYTLFRILETKGYRVVILDKQDDFRKVTEKMAARLKLAGRFDRHSLVEDGSPYMLQMSGFRIDDPALPGGGTFLTTLELDRIVRSLLAESGYSVKGK